jgi:hypothetical protein
MFVQLVSYVPGYPVTRLRLGSGNLLLGAARERLNRVPHLLFKQASMSKSSTSSGNFMLFLFSHSSSKTNCCVV